MEAQVQTPDPQNHEEAEKVTQLSPLPGLSDQEFQDLAASVLVVIPYRSGEGVNIGICNHFGMWGRIGLRVATVKDPHGGFIECTRGGIVQLFQEVCRTSQQIKYLVMIDNDEGIAWDAPLQLALHAKPVVTGVVCGYSDERGIFACFTVKDENGVARFPSWKETKTLPASGLIPIEQCGSGLVCIRRDVLDTIQEMGEEPFFVPESIRKQSVRDGQLRKSEDICFCDRAKKYGFDIFADLAVHAMHFKNIAIGWPADRIDPTIDAISWRPSVFDYKGVI